jgi:hypothetical protein
MLVDEVCEVIVRNKQLSIDDAWVAIRAELNKIGDRPVTVELRFRQRLLLIAIDAIGTIINKDNPNGWMPRV